VRIRPLAVREEALPVEEAVRLVQAEEEERVHRQAEGNALSVIARRHSVVLMEIWGRG